MVKQINNQIDDDKEKRYHQSIDDSAYFPDIVFDMKTDFVFMIYKRNL